MEKENDGRNVATMIKTLLENTGMVKRDISNDSIANYQEDDNEETEKTRQELLSDRAYRKLTISSDIEEVDEAIEEYEISASEALQRQQQQRDAQVNVTKTRLSIARSRMLDRAASMLEQRLKTISGLKELYEERGRLASKNRFLNKKLGELIKKTTTVNLLENAEGALPISENERYHAVLEEYIDTKSKYEYTKPLLERDLESITNSYELCRAMTERVFEELKRRELQIGSQCINSSKTGKFMSEQRATSLVKKQQDRFDSLAKVRVYYLRLNHRLAEIQAKARRLNHMGEGHTVMDYEQLVIQNGSYVDISDERDEELLKIQTKCAQCLSILSHMKETCDVFVYDITNGAAKLAQVVRTKSNARTLLAIECGNRESLRKATAEIRHASGLLGSPIMLRNMELDSKALDILKEKAQRLTEKPRDSSFISRQC